MKICKIYIKGFQQFQDVELDFTNPETGEPAEKICFIGSNGTGKSKLLRLINWLFSSVFNNFLKPEHGTPSLIEGAKAVFKISYNNSYFFIFHYNRKSTILKNVNSEDEKQLIKELFSLNSTNDISGNEGYRKYTVSTLYKELLENLLLHDNSSDLLIYSPADNQTTYQMGQDGVPETTVNDAMALKDEFPFNALVSADKVHIFWKLLVYSLRKREEDRDEFENLSENLNRTKQQLIDEFDFINPKILEDLAKIWNRILDKAGLYFDVKGANKPYQLTDNLKAYIKLKGTDSIVPYNELSTGIRNYIFRIGHIFSLYYNREIDRSFLLVDEPENSLYPDFLFELVETYQQIIIDKRGQNNTQMFFATHNPIIAAQFKPHERIILDWNKDGSVSARKGISPEGDDPNDILSNDFELKNLLGPEGRKMWEEYISLKKKLIKTSDDTEKSKLIHEIEKIGSLYNFS